MNQMNSAQIKLLQSGGCFRYIDRRADDAMQKIFAFRDGSARILSKEAAEQMKKKLSQRLIRLHQDVVFELLLKEDKKLPLQAAVSHLGDRLFRSSGAEVYEEAPLIAELEQRITEHFISSQTEFLLQFCESRKSLSEKLFEKRPVTMIRSFHHWSTFKYHGRLCVGVGTDAGTCYYKPRDCRIDEFYHHLVKTWFSDSLAAPSVVLGEGYGFCSEIVPDPVSAPRDIAMYIRNLGILLAVFTCLLGNDLKSCNIIPCGTFPAVIDPETMLAPHLNRNAYHTITNTEQFLFSSAAHTGLLFHWDSQKKKMVSMLSESEILPDHSSVCDYEKLLVEGFREGYFRILRIRRELLKDIQSRGNMMIRVLAGDSSRIVQIIEKSLEAPYLRSPEKKEKLYAHLSGNYRGIEPGAAKKLQKYDEDCISEIEPPAYSALIHGRELYGRNPQDLIAEDLLLQSPLERLQERLSRMSPDECAMSEDIIRRVARWDSPHIENEPECAYSWAVFRKLRKNAFQAPDRSLWWVNETGNNGNLCFLQASAAAYCTAILHKEKTCVYEDVKTAEEVRDACMKSIGEKFSRWETVDGNLELSAGLLQGQGGLLLDLALMERLDYMHAREYTNRFLMILSKEGVCEAADPGLMNGTSGLLLALCAVPVRKDHELELLRLDLIQAKTDALLQALRPSTINAAFVRNPDPFYGITGAGMALILAAVVLNEGTRSAEYMAAGIDLFTKTFEKARKDCFAEGIGLCAATALWFCKNPDSSFFPVRQCLDWAIEASSAHKQPAPEDSLHHGNALRALFWQMAGNVMNQPAYRDKAATIMDEIQSNGSRSSGIFHASLIKGDPGPGLLAMLLQ